LQSLPLSGKITSRVYNGAPTLLVINYVCILLEGVESKLFNCKHIDTCSLSKLHWKERFVLSLKILMSGYAISSV